MQTAGRIAAAVVVFAVGAWILGFVMTESVIQNRDFLEYWAVGHQLIHHQNPYDSAAIMRLFHSAGVSAQKNMILRNPPWALSITLPLGFLGLRAATIAWSLAIVAALMVSVRLLWLMGGARNDRLHMLAYCFGPVLACVLAGQLGVFLLFGATAFFYWHQSKPLFAGAALLLCLLKPHLFVPFGVALILWIAVRRAYRVLFGALIACSISAAASMLLDHPIWLHYLHGEKPENIQNLFIPCISVLVRILVNPAAVWIQFVPVVVGSVWAIWYFKTRRYSWSWLTNGPFLLLVSLLVAPYSWFTDEVLVLPAMFFALYSAVDSGRSIAIFGCASAIAMIEVIAGVPLTSGLYIWTMPAWALWYFWAVRFGRNPSTTTSTPNLHPLAQDSSA